MKVITLFQEKSVLRHVMKVPPHLRSDNSFEQAYSRLVKALVPTRAAGGIVKARTKINCQSGEGLKNEVNYV